jgi:hypothetical protein
MAWSTPIAAAILTMGDDDARAHSKKCYVALQGQRMT